MLLPADVLCVTADLLESHRPTLKSLCLTCKALTDYCQRQLFRTVSASILIGDGCWRRGTTGKVDLVIFREVVMHNSRLGAYVEDLYLSIDRLDSPGPQIEWMNRHMPQVFHQHLCPLIYTLVGLKTIRLESRFLLSSDSQLKKPVDIFHALSSSSLYLLSIRNIPFFLPTSKPPIFPLSSLQLHDAPAIMPQSTGGLPQAMVTKSLAWTSHGYTSQLKSLGAIRRRQAVDLSHLQHLEFSSPFAQDHYDAANLLLEAQLEALTCVIPCFSGGGNYTSLSTNLLRSENRSLFSHAKALKQVTFRISAEDITEDIAYQGDEWPRIFTWLVQSLVVFSECAALGELHIHIFDAAGPLFASLADDWKLLNDLLAHKTFSSLRKVSIRVGINAEYIQVEEWERLKKERDELAAKLFEETHKETDIVVEVVGYPQTGPSSHRLFT